MATSFRLTSGVVVPAVKGDWLTVSDASMTNGSPTLSSTSAGFTTGDVGKLVKVKGAAVGGNDLTSSISAFVSATQVTLATSASASVSNAIAVWASDDAPAIQAAIDSLRTDKVGPGYGTV